MNLGISWDRTLCSLMQIKGVSEEHVAFIFTTVQSVFVTMKQRAVLSHTASH
jgi:hypothetical protein